jgi:large subunit ribosomal protein L9
MSTKIILTQDVTDLGTKGQIVQVADGYARNYLIPRSMAVPATRGAVKQAEAMREAREETVRRARADADAMAEALVGMAARSGYEGKLFGSIGVPDITEAIKKFTGVEVERAMIKIDEPIKDIGLHEVTVQPHLDVEFNITLDVIPA